MADGVISGWREYESSMTSRQRVLCEFTEKLTVTPSKMAASDLEALRGEGLDDGEIVEVVHIIGYFNHINRVADALHVDRESFMPDEP